MTLITVKSRLEFKTYFSFIFRENFIKPLPILIFIFTLGNLFLLFNYYLKFMYFELKYPWFQMVLVAVVLFFIPLNFYFSNRKYFYSSPQLQEFKTFEITDDTVTISNENSTVNVEWKDFYRVNESKNFIILLYDYTSAYFINKRDFKSEQDLQKVYEIIKSKPGLVQALLK